MQNKARVRRFSVVGPSESVEVEGGERLVELALRDLVAVDEELAPEDSVKELADVVRGTSVRGLAVLRQFQGSVVDAEQVVDAALRLGELGLRDHKFLRDAILLGLEKFDRDGIVLEGLKKLPALLLQRGETLLEPVSRAVGALPLALQFARDLGASLGDLLSCQIDDPPEVAHGVFEKLGTDVALLADAALAPAAEEIEVATAVAVGPLHDEALGHGPRSAP